MVWLKVITTASFFMGAAAFMVPNARRSDLSQDWIPMNRPCCTQVHSQKQSDGAAAVASGDESSPDSEEFHASDPASTTAEFLSGLWALIARGNTMVRGESKTVLFPDMESEFTPRYLNLVTAHLDSCKDCCDFFGISTTLVPFIKDGRVKGFTIKSYRNPDKDPDNLEFAYDPFWDDGDDWNYEGIDEEVEAEEAKEKMAKYPEIVNKIPDDDEEITKLSKVWVDKICSDMGICPFSHGPDLAGLPIGPVYYTVDRSSSMEDMYARYWQEVVRVEQRDEKDLATTLLIAPEFCMENVEMFENFSTTLTQPLSVLGVEDLIQLVFFHPHWSFRDGGDRGGEGAAANYARRSPWPMINILRTKQVRKAQKGIPTGLVYKQNEKTLSSIGVDKLETMLRLRDWGEIADVKVDRKDMEALRLARDFQETGVISTEDTSLLHDATPAVNKVDGKQIEQGDMVNVISQALEKRLGKANGAITRLSGPETSAAIMASDFLLAELDQLIADPLEEELQLQLQSAVGQMNATAVSVLLEGGLEMDEATTDAAFWAVVNAVDRAEKEDKPLSADVPKMLHHIFDADMHHLLRREKLTTNITCMQPDESHGVEGAARRMNYIFDDAAHKDLPLAEGRKCEGGTCCDKCSRNIFPTFASEAESSIDTFPELASLTFNDLENVASSTILQFMRLIERVRRTIAHEYGLPLSTILPLQAYSRKYVAGTTQQGGGGGEGDFVILHTDESTHSGYHYSCVLYLSTQGEDFEGGDFVFNDPASADEAPSEIADEDDKPKMSLAEEIRRAGRKLTPFHPTRGAAVIFSSGWENMHEVETVTSGTRYAVPCFFTTCPVPEAAYEQMVAGKPKADEDIADDWLHLLLAHRKETPMESVGRVKELLMKWHYMCTPLSEH